MEGFSARVETAREDIWSEAKGTVDDAKGEDTTDDDGTADCLESDGIA